MLKNEHLSFFVSFNGRATRRDFNLRFAMVYFFGYLIAALMDVTFAGGDLLAAQDGLFSTFWTLLMLWPIFAVSCRRLHDLNISGWWQVPLIAASAGCLYFASATFSNITALNFDPETGLPVLETGPLLSILALLTICLVYFIMLSVKPGTKGPNKYGADPVHRKDVSHVS